MESKRRSTLVYGLLFAVWAVVVVWQWSEHARVKEGGRSYLRRNSKTIANTLGAVVRGQQFRGAVFRDRLEPVLNELVNGYTNEFTKSGELIAIALLNSAGEPIVAAGRPVDWHQQEILQEGERWGARTLTIVYPLEGVSLTPEGGTNIQAPLLLEAPTNRSRGFSRRDQRPPEQPGMSDTNKPEMGPRENFPPPNRDPGGDGSNPPPPPGERRGPPPGEGESRQRRPFWARGLGDAEYQTLIEKRELHGLVLTLSTDVSQAIVQHDLWLRCVICFFAGIAAAGAGFTWRNMAKTSDLQIRLVRASELNTHLKEMNLAAAGLAHETRNPLNIIRGMAQMLSKQTDVSTAIREKTRAIVDETDKVTAQLNEFINYSRPREVRRTALPLTAALNEVARALSYDVEEKKIQLEVKGEPLTVEADEQLFRQALFNLVLNATQAVGEGGRIQIVAQRTGAEAAIEVRDDGPGVPAERRQEIFKPYFTTHQKGTGLGLAVVQQIVLAHGWEIECAANEPKGAVFRIRHLKLTA
ncbi:MAG: ATP-binding protein [Verrucomicrobiota bacterium]